MPRTKGSKGLQVKQAETQTEKENLQAVLEARETGQVPVKYNDHKKNPARVAAAQKRKAALIAAGGDGCHIPLEKRRKGGSKGSRQGVPDGTTRKQMQKDLAQADAVLMQRLIDEDNVAPTTEFTVQKYLAEDKQKELGISINPLYEIQRMLLSGVLTPKDHASMLKELAKYTHQQAAVRQEVTMNAAERLLDAINEEPEKEDYIDGQIIIEGEKETR